MTNVNEKGIHLFVDASNLLYSTDSPLYLWKQDIVSLIHNVCNNRTIGLKFIAGSELDGINGLQPFGYLFNSLEKVYDNWFSFCYKIRGFERENGVDTFLTTNIQKLIDPVNYPVKDKNHRNPNLFKIVLFTGDGNYNDGYFSFILTITRALKYGWEVEVISYKHTCSYNYIRLARKYKNLSLRLIDLDEFRIPPDSSI